MPESHPHARNPQRPSAMPIGKYARQAYQKAGVPFPAGGSQDPCLANL